jgi:large subunit ribosomal protein L32
MAQPKRKTSKSRLRTRRHTQRAILNPAVACPQCGEPHQPHRVCPSCGTYRGRQVLTVSGD